MFNPNHRNHRKAPNNPNKGGFTLAEMLIATIILMILIGTAAATSANFFNSIRNIQAANVVYGEADFTMERIMKEIRSGTVDYEEYFNQSANFFGTETNETYGQNYCQYSRQFYGPGPDGQFGTFDDESTGIRRSDSAPITAPIQNKLYLIDASGTRRTYFQRVEVEKTNAAGKTVKIGKVAMLKLVGQDYGINHRKWNTGNNRLCRDSGEGDGLVDTWVCDTGFKCAKTILNTVDPVDGHICNEELHTPMDSPGVVNNVNPNLDPTGNSGNSSFVDITPDTIDVVSLEFIITPPDDPRKAYNEDSVQLQPNVSVKIVARAAPEIAATFKGNTPSIVLNSTVSARTTKEIITECNLQECIDGDKKPCPKNTGILSGSEQFCGQGIWPGCSETAYLTNSQAYIKNNVISLGIKGSQPDGSLTASELTAIQADGRDHVGPFLNIPTDFYESTGSENGSCFDDACRTRRCSDGVDNDVNGKSDTQDAACLNYICNNGYLDPGEECIDVGGICFNRQKQTESPNFCSDGYDNDCSYRFSWDALTPAQQAKATSLGLNSNSPINEVNIELGLGADEYDQNCIDNYFCANGIQDPLQLDPDNINKFGPEFYETPNYLFNKPQSDDLSEKCVDIGGLCDRATDEKHKEVVKEYDPLSANPLISSGALCDDGLDNDCDYVSLSTPNPITDPNSKGADEFDNDCKPAICGNGFLNQDLADLDLSGATGYFYNYLVEYTDALGQDTSLDETCQNVGGLCGGEVSEDSTLLCFDNIDNNCDGKFDGDQGDDSDSDCCQDVDADTYSPFTAMCSPLKIGDVGSYDPGHNPAYGTVDCNDSDMNIKPGATEICDDLYYPGDPTKPIDNNCSGANKLATSGDTGWDHADPSCCVDSDKDGFGINDANLYKLQGSPECAAIPTQLDQERTLYDCKDNEPETGVVNPNVYENTAVLCSDLLNNSCRFFYDTVTNTLDLNRPRMNHIDMYATGADGATAKASLKDAFDTLKYNPDCCQVTQNDRFPGMEICDDANSLLTGSMIGSDENCNGLEGMEDHFCVKQSGLAFHDSLTRADYYSPASDAVLNTATAIISVVPPSVDPPVQVALSNLIPRDAACAFITAVTLTADITEPLGTGIAFEASNDGGSTWEPISRGVVHNFTSTGSGLKWKATLTSDGVSTSPTIHSIDLTWICG